MNDSGAFRAWNRCAERAGVLSKSVPTALLVITLAALAAGAEEHPRRAELPSNFRYAALPLAFEQNRGQVNSTVKFLARASGYALFLTEKEALMSLERRAASSGTPSSSTGFAGRGAHHKHIRKDVLHMRGG